MHVDARPHHSPRDLAARLPPRDLHPRHHLGLQRSRETGMRELPPRRQDPPAHGRSRQSLLRHQVPRSSAATDYLQGAHAAAVAAGTASAPPARPATAGTTSCKARSPLPHPPAEHHQDLRRLPREASATAQRPRRQAACVVRTTSTACTARRVAKGGLAVAATCADCHGPHKVLPAKDPALDASTARTSPTPAANAMPASPRRIAASIHGQLLAKGDAERAGLHRLPHRPRDHAAPTRPAFKLDIVNECGTCHDKPAPGRAPRRSLYETYRRSYHGQVTSLGLHARRAVQRLPRRPRHPAASPIRISRLHARQSRRRPAGKCHKKADREVRRSSSRTPIIATPARYPMLHGVWLYFVIMMSLRVRVLRAALASSGSSAR